MKKYDTDKHHRHSLRLAGYDYSAAGAYFVTICTNNQQNLFGDIIDDIVKLNAAGRIVSEEWFACGHIHEQIILDDYVVMPNHFHGIVIFTNDIPVGAIHELPLHNPLQNPTRDKSSSSMTRQQRRIMALPKLLGRFKMRSARRINELHKTPGVPVWQRNYYEHIIRDENELNRIREYIEFNPIRWSEDEEIIHGKT